MKSIILSLTLVIGLTTPSAQAESLAQTIREACRVFEQDTASCTMLGSMQKRILIDDIVQLTFLLKVGPQDEDVIRIHRVVREVNGKPIVAAHGVFFTHGNLFGFEETFLTGFLSSHAPTSQSLAIFLASHNLDVWGIDLRWIQVPTATTDFAFMASWNISSDVQDVRTAMLIARTIRLATGSGFGKLHLAGWSSGGIINYALADKEAVLPSFLHQAKTLIPLDTMYKVDPAFPDVIQNACNRFDIFKALVDAGIFYSDEGAQVAGLTQLAVLDPDGPSPAVPGLTNRQAILFLVGIFPDPNPLVPFFHQVAVTFDDNGIPLEPRFSDEALVIDFLLSPAPFISLGQRVDFEQIFCDQLPSPHADNLDKIDLPVLYIGAEGGFGSFGTYTQSLFASTNVTNIVVRLEVPENRQIDFAHSELLLGRDAQPLIWQPVLDWILVH